MHYGSDLLSTQPPLGNRRNECRDRFGALRVSADAPGRALRLAAVLMLAGLSIAACSPDSRQEKSISDIEPPSASAASKPPAAPPVGGTVAAARDARQDKSPAAESPADSEPERRPLDLSPPKVIAVQQLSSAPADTPPADLFDGEDLFAPDKKSGNVSLKVKPILSTGEGETGPSRLEGGAVNFKIKTK